MRFCITVAIVSLRYRSHLPGSFRDAPSPTFFIAGHLEMVERSRIAAAQIESLSPRQKQVLDGMVSGLLNKQIAARLGISEKTVKLHRAQLLIRLCTQTSAAAVRVAVEASFAPARLDRPSLSPANDHWAKG